MANRTSMLVRMSTSLKDRLVHEVEARGGNLNDVAVGILAERFETPFAPSGRRGTGAGASGVVLLRLPPELKQRIQREAFEAGTNANEVVVRTLGERLGLPHSTTGRRTVPF